MAEFPKICGIAVKEGFKPEVLRDLGGDAFLLDAFDAKLLGGTGKPFNWALARDASRFGAVFDDRYLAASNELNLLNSILLADAGPHRASCTC